MKQIVSVVAFSFAALFLSSAGAADFQSKAYHGEALDASGNPLAGGYSLELRYFDTSGNALYREIFDRIEISDGHFDVKMGGGFAAGPTAFSALGDVFSFYPEIQLEIVIDEIVQQPRVRIQPAGHSQESRAIFAGAESKDEGPKWKGYRVKSEVTTVQAVRLQPAEGGRATSVPSSLNRQTNPFLADVISLGISPAVRDLPLAEVVAPVKAKGDGTEINPPRHGDLFDENGNRFGTTTEKIVDALASTSVSGGRATPAPLIDFEGIGNISGVAPPDTEGAVGPDHYVQVTNLSFAIFDKTGTMVGGPYLTNTLWSGAGGPCQSDNNGDAIFMYDEQADRWVFTQFAVSSGQAVCFAVSQTPDPTGIFNLYQINTQRFPDYFKLGVWPDPANNAYFMATNSGFQDQYDVYAIDRAGMLSGVAAQSAQYFQGYSNLMMPADVDGDQGPAAGSPGIFYTFRDGGEPYFGSPPTDSLDIYEFDVDWATPANSTFTMVQSFVPPEFSDFNWTVCGFFVQNCLPQPSPGIGLDSASWWPMQRLQFRNLGSYEALVGSWTVDVTGSPDLAAPRWFELQRTGGGPWAVHQEGTYSPDGDHRWMPSAAMDGSGNIAMGYSVVSDALMPSIRYTIREKSDPLGTMQAEATLITGTGVETGVSRWGDYASMEVDPADDCTFWFTTEYVATTGSFSWNTRVGAFKIPSCSGSLGLSVTPGSRSLCSSVGSTTYDIELSDPFNGTTNLTVTNCPSGATCSFTVNPIVFPATTSVLNVTGLAGVAAGDYTLTVTATDPTDPGNPLSSNVALTVFDATPGVPVLTSPANGAVDVDLVPTFDWEPSTQAVSYEIQVASDAAFSAIVESQAGLGATSYGLVGALDPVAIYYWRVRATNECGLSAWSAVFSLTTRDIPPILLVDDDDNGPDVRSFYTDALDAMGLAYDVWDTANSDNEPGSGELAAYRFVLWFTGDEFGGSAGPGSSGEAGLAAFLDGGGCFLISSQDYFYDRGLTSFMQNYLGVASADSDVGQGRAEGQNSFAGLGPYSLVYPFTDYSDWVVPDGTAEVAFLGDDVGQEEMGVAKIGLGSAAFYFGFPLEALPTQGDLMDVIARAMTFCGEPAFFADGFESGDTSAWSVSMP
ncbi:MAG: hypothetical protein ABFS37_07760 [Acidobacteriota bacterium]